MDHIEQCGIILMVLINLIIGASGANINYTMSDKDFEDAFRYHHGTRLDIQYSQNETQKSNLCHIMEQYNFARPYKIHEFDCTDMACITWEILKLYGYDVYIALSSPTHEDLSHVWILVSASDGWIGIEPTGDLPRIGAVYTHHPRYNDSAKFQQNCILLCGPNELLSWWPQLNITPMSEGIEEGCTVRGITKP